MFDNWKGKTEKRMRTRKSVLDYVLDANYTKREKGVEFLYGNIVCVESLTISLKTGREFRKAV